MCKHEFDSRYQKSEDKLYIAQLYFPLVSQVSGVDYLQLLTPAPKNKKGAKNKQETCSFVM